jgi:hypothetical protein
LDRYLDERYDSYFIRVANGLQDELAASRAGSARSHHVLAAVALGCTALEAAIDDFDLAADYREIHARLGDSSIALLLDNTGFEFFLNAERRALIRAGVNPEFADWLVKRCVSVRRDALQPPDTDALEVAINDLKREACRVSDELVLAGLNAYQQRTLRAWSGRVGEGVGGLVLIGINAGTLPATLGLSASAAAVSAALGGTLVSRASRDQFR